MSDPPLLEPRFSGRRRCAHATSAARTQIAEEVRALLIDATRIRLRSDVPVGSYLSGGLDSSIVAAIAGRLAPERLRTFSVRFDNPEFDETRIPARDGGGARHRPQRGALPRRPTSARAFPTVIRHAERPILRTAPAPLELLSGLVREEGFKVVLTGEGADEVFGGYDIFKEAKLRRFCARAAAIAPPPAALPKALSVSAEAAGAVGGLSEGVLRDRSRCGRRSAVLASAALPHDRRRKALLLRRSEARRLPATTRSTSCAPACRRISRAGTRCRRRNISKPRICCRATSSPRRATAWRWRTPSKAASRSSIIAWSRWRRRSRRAEAARPHREVHPAQGRARPRAASAWRERPKQPYRAPDSASFFGATQPAYVERLLAAPAVSAVGPLRCGGGARSSPPRRRSGRAGGFRDNAALTGILSTQLWREAFVPRRHATRSQPFASTEWRKSGERTNGQRYPGARPRLHRGEFPLPRRPLGSRRRRLAARERRDGFDRHPGACGVPGSRISRSR